MSRRRFVRASLIAAVLVAGLVSQATAGGPVPVRAGLFENYYVNPSATGSMGAKLYPCPRPVPAWVGHTYYTYEGLYPHEFMYPHMRSYYKGYGPLGVIPVNATHILYW
jgi:hypothetical protein